MPKVVDEQRVKQGRSGVQVLTVLIVALILAAIAWFFAESYGESIDTDANGPVQTAPAQNEAPAAPAPAAPSTGTAAPAQGTTQQTTP